MRLLAVTTCFAAWLLAAQSVSAQGGSLDMHIEFVADRYFNTPDGRGLLPTALAEAEIAARYADLAAADSTTLSAMRRYATYVLHAVDPTMASSGPGLGYGVRAATRAVLNEIDQVLAYDSLPEPVLLHATHVSIATRNALARIDEVIALATQLRGAGDRAQAASAASRLLGVTDSMLRGTDGNGDGRRGWPDGDEGLKQASYHMTLLKQSER